MNIFALFFLKGSSDTLVVSFGDLISRAKGMSINAEKSLIKYQYNVISIVCEEVGYSLVG